MGINARIHRVEARIRAAPKAYLAIITLNILYKPLYSIICIRSLIYSTTCRADILKLTATHKPTTNILIDKYITTSYEATQTV